MKYRKKIPFCVLLLGILLTALIGAVNVSNTTRRAKVDAEHILDVYSVRTESLLDSLFHKTDILESVIITSSGDVPEATFQDLAKSLMQDTGIRAIQYLPDGIVKYCYPLEENRSAIGDNVFEMPARREDALLALRTKEIALSGPYELTQGGWGLVARNPIFLTGDNGEEYFWGFSVVVLDLPDALKPLMLEELRRQGYQYCIYADVNGVRCTIAQSEGYQENNPLLTDIQVPGHTWEFAISPVKSWADYTKLLIICIVGLSITVLCTIIARMLLERAQQLQRYADMDLLTGTANRRKLYQYFKRCAQKENVPMMLLYVDIDKFKQINDTYGHSQGDILLKVYAERMLRFISEEDMVARLGGDEFVILMLYCDLTEDFAKRICALQKTLAEDIQLDNTVIKASASIGHAFYPSEAADLSGLLELADQRMYAQKTYKEKDEIQ